MAKQTTTPAVDETELLEYVDVSTKGKGKADAYFMPKLPLADIDIIKGHNPRGEDLGDLTVLKSGIKKRGLGQPIVVREHPKNPERYQLVAGERRLTSMLELGWETTQAIVRRDLADDNDALMFALAENSGDARFEPNPAQLGRSFLKLEKAGLSINAIARESSYHPQKVRRCLTLVKDTPKNLVESVEAGEMGMMAAVQVGKLDPALRKELKDKITPDMTVTDIKKLAKKAESDKGKVSNSTSAPTKARAVDAVTWQSRSNTTFQLAQTCAVLQDLLDSNEKEDLADIGTANWYLNLGNALALLMVRGDIESLPQYGYLDDDIKTTGTLVLDPDTVEVFDEDGLAVEAPTASATKKAVADAQKEVKAISASIKRYAKVYHEKYADADVEEDEEGEEETE